MLKETSQERKDLFQFDTELLRKLKLQISSVRQVDLEADNHTSRSAKKRKSYYHCIMEEKEDNEQKKEEEVDQEHENYEELKRRLQRIKKKNPEKFNELLNQGEKIKKINYLSTTPYSKL